MSGDGTHHRKRGIPQYFPPTGGMYEVKPGLIKFGKPLGGGEADGHVFQLDETFRAHREVKLAARSERLAKYYQTHRFERDVERSAIEFIARRLAREHPREFQFIGNALACALTDEKVELDSPSALDSLACQVQEDLAIVSSSDESGSQHWLSAIHLCFPNNWAAEEKIGRRFEEIHAPVAGMEQMNRQAERFVSTMLEAKDGLVRFAWGITWDDELNHHPEPPPGARRVSRFDPVLSQAFVRVERQTIWGLSDGRGALFTIRTYLYDCAEIRTDPQRRDDLIAAIKSMKDASMVYKGLSDSRNDLLRWLAIDDDEALATAGY